MKFAFGPETHPLPGYTIKRAIDRGGFGEVYFALSDSGKEVALKLLRDNPDIELRGVSQCLNLKHPNLVTIFDVRVDADGDSWVIMEFISGESLEHALAKHPQGLPLVEVIQWLTGAADGIAYLHERGIVHRDLKPANIFCDQGIVKVGDVGLSKFMSPNRRSAQTESVGTVHYMAPEVARGKYGRELDVYSLAIIVYEMLTGRVPFNGESSAEILMKHLTARPDLSVVAAGFRPVLERALEKDPHRRTPTVRQFTEEFQRAFQAWRQEHQSGIRANAAEFPRTNGFDRKHGALTQTVVHSDFDTPRRGPEVERGPRRGERGRASAGNSRGGSDSWIFSRIPNWILIAVPVAFVYVTGRSSWGRGFFPLRTIPAWGWFYLVLAGGAAYVTYLVVSSVVTNLLSRSSNRDFADVDLDSSLHDSGKSANLRSAAPANLRVAAIPRASPPVRPLPRAWLGPEMVRPISLSSRWQDIFASMTWATFWTVISTAVVSIGFQLTGSGEALTRSPGHLAVFAFTTLAAAWTLLPVTKLMEGSALPGQHRRLILAIAGGAVGIIAWLLSDVLMAFNSGPAGIHGLVKRIGNWDLLGPGPTSYSPLTPTLAGYMTFFAVLFALRRWNGQTDSFRIKRFRWLSWMFTGVVAWAVTAAFSFPAVWAIGWGLALSAIVQLSSGWIKPDERSAWVSAEQLRIASKRNSPPTVSESPEVMS